MVTNILDLGGIPSVLCNCNELIHKTFQASGIAHNF